MINNNFYIIVKKNNQTSVSDANPEIPTLGSMDNAGPSVKLVSGIIHLPSVWDFSICIRDHCKILFIHYTTYTTAVSVKIRKYVSILYLFMSVYMFPIFVLIFITSVTGITVILHLPFILLLPGPRSFIA